MGAVVVVEIGSLLLEVYAQGNEEVYASGY